MTLIQTEPKKIYLGNNELKAVYLGDTKVRPVQKYKTYTVVWNEVSNPANFFVRYEDDAAGMTQGSTDWDTIFNYSAVKLSNNGTETAELNQTSPGVLPITQLGTITSGDNVMIKFPVRGIKMSKSGSTVTLSITEELDKDGYQYYAHSTGTLASPGTSKDAFYLGAYKATVNSSNLKSWSTNNSPTTDVKPNDFYTYAKANGSGYNLEGLYQRMYINALYMMKYGNPDSQTVIGNGNYYGRGISTVGRTNSSTDASGYTGGQGNIKLFGLEDRWGNVREFIAGCYLNSSRVIYASLNGWSGATTGLENTGITMINSYGNITGIAGTNKGMFIPISKNSNTSYNTYYSDYTFCSSYPPALCSAGGTANYSSSTDGKADGAFRISFNEGATSRDSWLGARLMYLNGLT